jgi:galactonate dehydratase
MAPTVKVQNDQDIVSKAALAIAEPHEFGGVHYSDTDIYLKGLLPPKNGAQDPSVDPIKSIEHFRIKPRWLFVRVETEKGFVGWGEATLEGAC